MAETNNSSGVIRTSGDINIEKIEVISLANDASFNVTNQVITIQIFEDLFSPFMTGSLIFKDSLDLINNLPMVGMEFVDIKMFTPSLDKSLKEKGIIQGRFYIYKMTEREYIAEKSVVYQLHFIAAEALNDLNIKLSKGFEGKVSDIAKKLIKGPNGLETDKILTIEETKNSTRYISNYWGVVKNINYILQQATSPNNSTTYLFFENRSGFNFVSLDYLNELPVYQKFKYGSSTDDVDKTGGSSRNLDRDFSEVLEMSAASGFDYIDRIRHGTYASKLVVHDMTTKRYKTVAYDYLKKFSEGKETRLNKFPITTDTVAARVGATIIVNEIANQVFSSYGDVSNIKVVQDRVSRMKQAEAFKLQIKIKGRTDYTVGQKISLSVTTAEPTRPSDTPKQNRDKMYSGNYLISAINHVISKKEHDCYIEIIKDSLEIDVKAPKK